MRSVYGCTVAPNVMQLDDLDRGQLEQILKLTKENNRMLHAMRRNAWLGGIFKLLVWAALIVLPVYLYMQYLAPVMESTMETLNQMQGAGTRAQAQFGELNDAMQKLQNLYPQYFQGQQ